MNMYIIMNMYISGGHIVLTLIHFLVFYHRPLRRVTILLKYWDESVCNLPSILDTFLLPTYKLSINHFFCQCLTVNI